MEPPPAFGVPVISPPVKCKYRNVNVPPSILKWRLSFAAVIVTKLFISIFVPIENDTVHRQVLEQIFIANINDNEQSWILNSDGTYRRLLNDEKSFSAHNYFMKHPSLSGQGKSLSLVKDLLPNFVEPLIRVVGKN